MLGKSGKAGSRAFQLRLDSKRIDCFPIFGLTLRSLPYSNAHVKIMRAFGLLIGRFLVVYLPAFTVVAALRISIDRAVPTIIGITTIAACLAIFVSVKSKKGTLVNFGLHLPKTRYIGYAFALGLPFAVLIAVVLTQIREPGPLAGLHIASWLALAYFGLAAPVQEEIIFRGLLQGGLNTDLLSAGLSGAKASRTAVVVVALLFTLIHLEVGPVTAVGACVLGILAGELRRRSSSLVPAILCHMMFNLAGMYYSIRG